MAAPLHSRRTFLGVTLPEETDFHVGVEAWGRGDYDRAVQEFQLFFPGPLDPCQVFLMVLWRFVSFPKIGFPVFDSRATTPFFCMFGKE